MGALSRRAKWLGGLAAAVVVATLALSTFGSQRTLARLRSKTAVGYPHTTPPPWPEGNCFSVISRWTWLRERYLPWLGQRTVPGTTVRARPTREWHVVNMHAENFGALSQQLGFDWVRVEPVGDRGCLVVDKRVPREWLRAVPCESCVPLAMRQKLRTDRPECFREDPQVRALVGTTWTLVDREDPEGAIARLLPGEQIHFGATELSCATAAGKLLGSRPWERPARVTGLSISVYDVRAGAYTGLSIEVLRDGNTLTLTPRAKFESDGRSFMSGRYEVAGNLPRARYRSAGPGSPSAPAR